jgi:hypothetical protein
MKHLVSYKAHSVAVIPGSGSFGMEVRRGR